MAKRRKVKPIARDLKVYSAFCAGEEQSAIGARFGLTQGRVSQIAAEVSEFLRPQVLGQIPEIRQKHTLALWNVYLEAMAGWERSKKNAEMDRVESGEDGGKTIHETRGQCGDPAYLVQAMKALEHIRKIWGADAPTKVAQTNPEGTGPVTVEVVIRDRDELAKIRSLPELQQMLHGQN